MNNERTPEQQAREDLLIELQKAIPVPHHGDTIVPLMAIWLHFTDWYNYFDIDRLLAEDCLQRDPYQHYEPNGTYQDKYPPSCYRLTYKGWQMLTRPGEWVWKGEFKKAKPNE